MIDVCTLIVNDLFPITEQSIEFWDKIEEITESFESRNENRDFAECIAIAQMNTNIRWGLHSDEESMNCDCIRATPPKIDLFLTGHGTYFDHTSNHVHGNHLRHIQDLENSPNGRW